MRLNFLSVFLISLFIMGCSGADHNVAGTYIHSEGKNTELIITKDGKWVHPKGSGEYTIEGNEILLIHSLAGGAKGTIEENKLVFTESNSELGERIQGTWMKKD